MPMAASEHRRAPLQRIAFEQLCSTLSQRVCERRWSALVMIGHGRSYCGLAGHLCGARPLHVAPDAPAPRCVEGLACVSPADGLREPGVPGFPRIDPRRYDAPIMVIDTCVAGGWASPEWDTGTPAIAIHAFTGAASAVVCSDFSTISSAIDEAEPFAALHEAATIGEAVARLNRAREGEVEGVVRYLLGDPTLPLKFSRWSEWCAKPIEQQHERSPERQRVWVRASLACPFVQIELGLHDASETTTHVHCSDGEPVLGSAHLLDVQREPKLWVALKPDRTGSSEGVVDLWVETRPTPRLPEGLLDAALLAPLLVRSWTDPLQPHGLALMQAAARIEDAAELLDRLRGRALIDDGEHLHSCVPLCRAAWLDAHLEVVRAVCALASGGLAEDRLWRGMDYRSRTIDLPCPHCGAAPTLERHYRSPPALARTQWECVACTLIHDLPSVPTPRVSLSMPARIEPDQTIQAVLRLDNRDGDRHFAIAGALLLDRDGHGVEAPSAFAVELSPGAIHEQHIELRSSGRPAIAHRYYARAPILCNGVWCYAVRLISVLDG
jgi:hypothetical protein